MWPQWLGIGILAIGLIVTWIKNGRNKSEEYGALKKDVEKVNQKLDNENYGLIALNNKVGKFETHCASVSGRLDERVKVNDKRLDRLEAKANTRHSKK